METERRAAAYGWGQTKKERLLRRFCLPVGLVGLVLAVAATGTAGNAKERFQLKGEVYPNSAFKIEMENAAGRKLTTVKAGTYRIKIEDMATIHNFHLKGPGVNKATSVSGETETTWKVRLRRGKYTFMCDPHASTMRGSFRVT
jgi:plastocyanin